jgi:glyoxylase-like metal-dependent hydrolase (beta-lactamase superfamily II)
LTHEHFDHIAGVISIQNKHHFELFCSKNTAEALTEPRKNLSAFNDQMNPVIINQVPTILADNEEVILLGSKFHFLITPGHSPGSLCFLFDQYFFSGDTLLKQQKTRLNLPGSDKEQYKLSLEKINKLLTKGVKIYPGHGESFIY